MMNHPQRFKCIIVGGSVAGLTLAHCFEQAGIDYVLLEGRNTIAPQLGASIVIMPNGARILDQMGIYESMRSGFMQKMRRQFLRRSDGRKVTENEWPRYVEESLGYECGICERRLLLRSLYDQLKDKSRIYLSKKVMRIEQSSEEAKVICADDSVVVGDIIIGADGIHSRTRREMQRLADETGSPGLIDEDKTCVSAEYDCFYGIAEADYKLIPGDSHITVDIDHSSLLFVSRDGSAQWFFTSKLDKKYVGDDIPRLSKAYMDKAAEEHKDYHLTENVRLKDIISTSRVVSCFPLEEANHEVWTYGRIVCIGDAIHKMTPNLGQGGNQAIESAAVLTNCILDILGGNSEPQVSQADIETALLKYQDLRQDRSRRFVQISAMVTRNDALATLRHVLRFLYKQPFTGQMLANIQIEMYHTAPYLTFLPIPERVQNNPTWNIGIEKMKVRDDIPTGSPYRARL